MNPAPIKAFLLPVTLPHKTPKPPTPITTFLTAVRRTSARLRTLYRERALCVNPRDLWPLPMMTCWPISMGAFTLLADCMSRAPWAPWSNIPAILFTLIFALTWPGSLPLALPY
jgi:hypothetical protein